MEGDIEKAIEDLSLGRFVEEEEEEEEEEQSEKQGSFCIVEKTKTEQVRLCVKKEEERKKEEDQLEKKAKEWLVG